MRTKDAMKRKNNIVSILSMVLLVVLVLTFAACRRRDTAPSPTPTLSPMDSPTYSPQNTVDPDTSPITEQAPQETDSGASGEKMPDEARVDPSGITNYPYSYDSLSWRAQMISNELVQREGVKRADVILMGGKAVVGLQMDEYVVDPEGKLLREIQDQVEVLDPTLGTVSIVTDSEHLEQLQSIISSVRRGNNGATVVKKFNDLVQREQSF
ncbi:MAG: YhcN/YlaJ family sporulation lipoprotein [Christensenellales bacterium]